MLGELTLPDFLVQPTDGEFIAACIAYGIGLVSLALVSRSCNIKRLWLLGGIAAAVALGLCTGSNLRATILDFMPWTVMLFLFGGTALRV